MKRLPPMATVTPCKGGGYVVEGPDGKAVSADDFDEAQRLARRRALNVRWRVPVAELLERGALYRDPWRKAS